MLLTALRVLGALAIALLAAAPAVAEEHLQLRPRAVRPGNPVVVKVVRPADLPAKIVLRFSGPTSHEVEAEGAQARRGAFQVVVPKELRQGRYDVELFNEAGTRLREPAKLRILATEKPVISRIVPHPTYAVNDRYTFELVGEHFGHEAEDNVITINDVPVHIEKFVTDRSRKAGQKQCEDKLPCVIGNRRSLKIYGLAPARQTPPFYRPLRLNVQVDSMVSENQTLLLSWAQRETPTFIAFGVLAVLTLGVYLIARTKAARYTPFGRRYSTLAYLFIDPETNSYSLSRLQLITWTAAAIVACTYLAACQWLVQWQWQLPKVPDGLAPLLGVSVGTTALAIGATEARGSKGAGPAHPSLGDFITTGGTLAPERLQFFLWTVLGVIGFVGATLAQDPATVTELPKIPENVLPLMGVSSLGYLAGKVVRKPGPIIKQLVPAALAPGAVANGIRIVGENLSPRAQVWIGGRLIPTGGISVPAPQSAASEFVNELVVSPAEAAASVAPAPPAAAAAVAPPARPAPTVKVMNLDGQSAEI